MLNQKAVKIAEGLVVGPVGPADQTCPLSVLGVTMHLSEVERRHLAAYLVAGLPWLRKSGSLASQILESKCGRLSGFMQSSMMPAPIARTENEPSE